MKQSSYETIKKITNSEYLVMPNRLQIDRNRPVCISHKQQSYVEPILKLLMRLSGRATLYNHLH